MKQQRKAMKRLSDLMASKDLPGIPIVELAGNRRLLIENHNGIVEYERDRICVLVAFGRLVITGSQLEICCMSKAQLVITGRIESVGIDRGCDECCSR